jgi:prolyl oligopeptidase
VADVLHGTSVADPFRWLEDLNSAATADWVRAQNAFTESWFANGGAQRAQLRERLTALWNYPRVAVPTRLRNGVLFYQRNSGLQKQDEIVARSSLTTPPRVVIDPNLLSPDGSTALTQYAPSPDGRFVAYALSEGGADWQDVRVHALRAATDLPEVLRWVRFSAFSWTADSKGFFYSRYPARDERTKLSQTLEHHALYYHRVGTPQEQDVLVYARPDLPSWFVFGSTSDDGRYLFIVLSAGADSRNRLYAADLGDPRAPAVGARVVPIAEDDAAEYSVIGSLGTVAYLRTDAAAPHKKIVAVDLRRPNRARWRTIIAEGRSPIAGAALTKTMLVVHRLADVRSALSVYSHAGSPLGTIALPGAGSVTALSATTHFAGFSYAYTSSLSPSKVYRWDAATRRNVAFEPSEKAFDAKPYETFQTFARSRDGTRVPIAVTLRKGLPRDGSTPTLLYAYGGFAINILPSFSPAIAGWLEMGGAYATATLRGGAEYGEAWHRAGMLEKKQNVFDDFIAAAEHLIGEGITSPPKLAIQGASNGGLLVGAVMTQRPELFGVAIPEVGVLDMLRYHRFTGGAAWATEYGSADEPDAFKYLLAYSPLHHVKPGTCYPATLITTADHDDRVVPSHSFKFAATLQAAQGCDKPVFIRVETHGSHGYRPTDKLIAETADVWTFAAAHLGLVPPPRRAEHGRDLKGTR